MTSQLNLFPEQIDLPPGMVAIMRSGCRIAIWPCESDDPSCFTGQLLELGASYARACTHNLSCLWMRKGVERVEFAKPGDQQLSLVGLRVTEDAHEGNAPA